MEKMKIGFVGLGLMGSGMTGNLLSAGFPLLVYDIDPEKTEVVAARGAQRAEVPADMAQAVDVIILSLPNSHVVDEVVINDLKLLDRRREGLVIIDTTTADPIMSEALAARLRDSGMEMLDATISGTSKMCEQKDITFMVGGAETVFNQSEPIFSALADKTYYLGKNGSGALMKLIVNLVLGLNRMVLAEGLSLGRKAGMDLHRLLEVLKNSAAYSRAMDMKGGKMVEEDFLPPEGKLAFHLKDVRLMLDLAGRLDVPLVLSSIHAQALTTQVAKGRGEWDNAAIISFYKDITGV
jgi:3-hydroxyisobutyrate dehydrogenase-like beta-hydroxyacid dehydrogenase